MKYWGYNFLIGFLLLLQGQAAFAAEPLQEFTKSLQREFAQALDGTTALYNKYGKINVNTWNKQQVKIDVTITVNASSQREADKTFDLINVNFINTWGYVKAETMVNYLREGGDDIRINYEVWMPHSNQLDLKNRYGNAWVGALTGKLIVEMRYGDLRTETVSNDIDLNLNFGKAYIKKANNIIGQLNNVELALSECKDLQLDTKYSKIRTEKSGNMRLTSRFDDFQLGRLEELRLQTKYTTLSLQNAKSVYVTAQFSDLKLNAIATALDADVCNGSLNIEDLNRNFSEVNIIAKHTGVNINVARGAAYRIDAQAQNSDIHYPENCRVRSRTDTGGLETLNATFGEATGKNFSIVKARMTFGDFVINMK
jgi:hypothetical protein